MAALQWLTTLFENTGGIPMNKFLFFVVITLWTFSSSGFVFAAEKKPPAEFNVFYKKLSQVVKSNNRPAIFGLMPERFQWAMDADTVSKEKAMQLMDENKSWSPFKKALRNKPKPIEDSSCQKGKCYAVWSKDPSIGFIFKLIDGQWKWAEFRAD